MLKFLCIIIFLFFTFLDINAQDDTDNFMGIPKKVISYNDLGVSIGNPSALNLMYIYHFYSFLCKVSGNYLGELNGLQLEFGFVNTINYSTYHGMTVSAGFSNYPKNNNIFGTNENPEEWRFISINYLISSKDFFLSLGGAIGEGDLSSPRVNISAGYILFTW